MLFSYQDPHFPGLASSNHAGIFCLVCFFENSQWEGCETQIGANTEAAHIDQAVETFKFMFIHVKIRCRNIRACKLQQM